MQTNLANLNARLLAKGVCLLVIGGKLKCYPRNVLRKYPSLLYEILENQEALIQCLTLTTEPP